ncbi:hypothetical protein [Ruminococcus flavefaciens]|uniref:hypothetical protein n=1 Tax=Ruminococcus flavefaciens TaxID=1265 RepID=UPI000A76199E|nr:hypothetical protein [Ruminococcus flavefaciens]
MEYDKGYVYELMDKGGPTRVTEPYFKEAVDEMMRARTLCAKANAVLPDDPSYVGFLEELFGRKLDNVRILTPFTCDFGNRVTFGKGVFINHSAILSASGGIDFPKQLYTKPLQQAIKKQMLPNRKHLLFVMLENQAVSAQTPTSFQRVWLSALHRAALFPFLSCGS